MKEIQTPEQAGAATPPPFRVDQKLHQILYKSEERTTLQVAPEPQMLPEPVYPQHPDPQPMSEQRIAPADSVSLHGMEMQSGLPLLLVLQQQSQRHDGRHGEAFD